MIPKFVLHLAKQNTPSIHIWLGQNVAFSLWTTAPVQEAQNRNSFHHTSCRIAQEFTARFEAPVDSNVVLGSHVEIAGLWRVVGGLFGDIVAFGVIGKVPVAGVGLAQNGIEGLLDSSVM